MTISLGGTWQLYFRPEHLKTGEWTCIPAQVPGNVELDLVRAGLEEDPFYGDNLYNFRKYEFYEWRFERKFVLPADLKGQKLILRLCGVNLYADVYVNGNLLGSCANMLIDHTFDMTAFARFDVENQVCVYIHSANNKARNTDYPVLVRGNDGMDQYVFERRPPHSYGWDIMPHLPSAGLWRDVIVETEAPERLTQVYYAVPEANERCARLLCKFRFAAADPYLENWSVRFSCGGVQTEIPAVCQSGQAELLIEKPRLWWPRGYGEPALCEVTCELLHNGQIVDAKTEKIGLRHAELVTKFEKGDEGQFLFKINGVPILAKGSNWVPLDAMHSRDADRYEQALALFEEAGCNILRCWGGNVYEDSRFYELCDEKGIMVWQDFTMACALYPQSREFLDEIEREATFVIRKLRNHPCIVLWAGDNECDDAYSWNSIEPGRNRYSMVTREVLPRAVRLNDPYRTYLPSSPYIPDGQRSSMDSPEQHVWGARAYFKADYYKQTPAHFISECGYHGCPAPESLKKFIPEDRLWPYTNDTWRTHSTEYLLGPYRGYNRNQLMADQVHIFFGEVPDTLEEFSALSQVVQAEAKKFFVERTRIKKWRRTGMIWWNMLDGWPQISDAIVDYYFQKKRAFNYIRRVQEPICLMMDELNDWTHDVVLGNDSRHGTQVRYTVTDGETGETLLQGEVFSPANENVTVGSLRVLCGQQKLFLLKWEADGKTYHNHYITGNPCFDKKKVFRWLDTIDRMEE